MEEFEVRRGYEMTLDQDIDEMKKDISTLKNKEFPRSISRPGLYLYVILGTAGSLVAQDYSQRAYHAIEEMKPKPKVENVIGNEEPETFYEIDGKRVYLKVDGKPVDQYFTNPSE